MKISILTPSYNQSAFIEKNILSVMNQNWVNYEHIIIDGGSTDGTIEILKKYPHLKWKSERDEGQADALNKGIQLASGDIIGWINSDDYYAENIFKEIIIIFQNTDYKWIIGNITRTYPTLNIHISNQSPEISYRKLINNPDIVKQQATFFRKKTLLEVGAWDKTFYMTMDYDLWIRVSSKHKPLMVPKNWAYFTNHVEQKTSQKNLLIQIKNIKEILYREKVNKLLTEIIIFKKYIYYLKSIIKNRLIKAKIIDYKKTNIPISLKRKLR